MVIPLFSPNMRWALSRGAYPKPDIEAYLPSNYTAYRIITSDGARVLLAGVDQAGWTLHDYVIPRLASGLYWFEEIDVDRSAELLPAPYPRCVICGRELIDPSGETLVCSAACDRDLSEELAADRFENSLEMLS